MADELNPTPTETPPQENLSLSSPAAGNLGTLELQLAELRNQNAMIMQHLASLQNPTNTVVQAPAPTFTEEDFRERPASVLKTLVGQEVGSRIDQLRNDIARQLDGFNRDRAESARERNARIIAEQLKNNGAFPRLREPEVEKAFINAMSSVDNPNIQAAQAAYYLSVGVVSENSGRMPQTPSSTPAHIRPRNSPGVSGTVSLPALSENEEKIRKEYNWSHARAAFAFKKISQEDYLKLEPDAKIPEGFR